MNIYQKKIVKEKEFFFNEDCIQTKSTYPNSKPDSNSLIHSNINIRKFYGINSNKINKNANKKNSHPRSKSQIITNKERMEHSTPKEIKTVLIKLKKPFDQNNNNNYMDNINYRTQYVNKFYKKKFFNINNINNISNEFKTLEVQSSHNKKNTINKNMSFKKKNYNINIFSSYRQNNNDNIEKRKKPTRNKSVILNNEDNNSFNNIYKKSFCLDKHKNYGGNFKNKERSRTNPKINHNKSFKKKLMINNISPPIHNLMNIEDIQTLNNVNFNILNKNTFHYANTNGYQNLNLNRNFNNINNSNNLNRKKNINIQYDLSIVQAKDNKMNNNSILISNDCLKEKRNDIEFEICKNNEDLPSKKNKLKVKNIPPLNFKNNIQNTANIINMDSKDIPHIDFLNNKYLNNYNNTSSKINITKNKNNNNILTFEEPLNDEYSIKNYSNLLNLVNISDKESKINNINHAQNNPAIEGIIDDYISKIEKNKPKIKVKKTSNNNKKLNMQKIKSKSKGKIFKNNSTKNIGIENERYNININNNNKNISQIKSIPLKLNNSNNIYINNQNKNNKFMNNPKNIDIKNNNDVVSNIIFINKKDFELWNDLKRIYENNGKYQ